MLPTIMGGKGAENSLYYKGEVLRDIHAHKQTNVSCVSASSINKACAGKRKLCVLIRLMA